MPASPRPSAGGSGISAGSVYVHVLGQVAHPGLYVLDDGARVAEALAAAGGTLPDADLGAVNLARPLVDGEQILVPAIGAAPAGAAPGSAGAGAGAAGAPGGLIDLNTADAAALETLPRIGPALAQRIIDWRTANGRFTSVDDCWACRGSATRCSPGSGIWCGYDGGCPAPGARVQRPGAPHAPGPRQRLRDVRMVPVAVTAWAVALLVSFLPALSWAVSAAAVVLGRRRVVLRRRMAAGSLRLLRAVAGAVPLIVVCAGVAAASAARSG